MSMPESEILELHLRSVNYLRSGDRKIGETKLRWVESRTLPGTGRYKKHLAYERPSTRERFRVVRTDYEGMRAASEASS